MNLDESGSENVFRSSELSTYVRCPRQLGYRRILGLKIRPSATMIGGTSIDDTLTEHHGQRIKGLNGLRGSALVDYFVDKFRKNINQAEAEGPLSGEPDPDIIRDGTGVLPVYEEKIDPIIEPLSVQKEVSKRYKVQLPVFKMEETEIPKDVIMVGHIDLERQSRNFVTISDHKFTSKAPSQMSAALSTQLHTYDELDGDGTHHVELILLRRLKKPEVVTTSHFVTKEQRGHVVMTLKAVAWAVTRRFFPMAPRDAWWCSASWCGYYKTVCVGRPGGPLLIPGEVSPPTQQLGLVEAEEKCVMDIKPKELWDIFNPPMQLTDKVHTEKMDRLIDEARQEFDKGKLTHNIEGLGLASATDAMELRYTIRFLTKIAASDAFTPEQCKLAAGLKARLIKIVNGDQSRKDAVVKGVIKREYDSGGWRVFADLGDGLSMWQKVEPLDRVPSEINEKKFLEAEKIVKYTLEGIVGPVEWEVVR